jgi:ribosomal protein S18 acetylase RimI-like enzyme
MAVNIDLAVRRLDSASGRDPKVVDRLTILVNDVYATAENGLWRDGATRTTASEVADLVGAGEIAVATTPGGLIVGSVRVRQVSHDTSEFGMLVAAPDHRGVGIGRALVDFVEQDGRDRGLRAVQLELLVPRTWRHPSKEFLKAWYGRRGYRLVETRRMDDAHPHLAPLLATPCDLEVYEKRLRDSAGDRADDDALASELAESGPSRIEDELVRFVERALRSGADPLLGSIVLDRGQPDVTRQRAFGAMHQQVVRPGRRSSGATEWADAADATDVERKRVARVA